MAGIHSGITYLFFVGQSYGQFILLLPNFNFLSNFKTKFLQPFPLKSNFRNNNTVPGPGPEFLIDL